MTVDVSISGLKPFTKHGVHIHEFGDIRESCINTGRHYNPTGSEHGSRISEVRHLGDLGNLEANMNGIVINQWKGLDMDLTGPFSILGRSCVIHKNEDDLGLGSSEGSKSNGNSGLNIGCGVVGWIPK